MVENELTISNAVLIDLMKDAASKGSSFKFQVKGFSMLPFIRDNDVLTISPFSPFSNNLGNSVAFIHPKTESLIIHRLIAKHNNSYIVKGDNIPTPDGLISRKDIVGFVSGIERKGKKVLFGFGPERFLIVLLSRINIFFLLISVHRFMRQTLRRFSG
ncbi:MAG: S26 family signal peptidase [Candidatus Omnitrophota bacterium]